MTTKAWKNFWGGGLKLLLTYSLIPNAREREREREEWREERSKKHLNRMIMKRRGL
jgi:hypothetical protein